MQKRVATLEPNDHDTLPHPSAPRRPRPPARPPGRFQYASGDRPLAGYTIKRGVGQGGFGEIYYAQSDAGKDVALKLIRRNLEVELRGIRQCLNLKHPHLLDLYDIRQDDRGDTWVVMEYIADESLEDVLASRPNGLPPDGVSGLDPRHRGRRGLSARARHRTPRSEAGQHLLRRRRGEGGRLRPVEVHLVQPPQRTHREHRHRPLHGARGGQRPLRQGDRRLRPGRDPLRTADRPSAFRGREHRRGADEAPDGQARRVDAPRAVSRRRGPGDGERPCPAIPFGGRDAGRVADADRRSETFFCNASQ